MVKAAAAAAPTTQLMIPIENHQSPSGGSTEVVLSKDAAKLRTLTMFEPWIKRDQLDVRSGVNGASIDQSALLLERSAGQISRTLSIRR